jgi:hypothetical protein
VSERAPTRPSSSLSSTKKSAKPTRPCTSLRAGRAERRDAPRRAERRAPAHASTVLRSVVRRDAEQTGGAAARVPSCAPRPGKEAMTVHLFRVAAPLQWPGKEVVG